MRLIAAAIFVMAMYFAASLLWPAHDPSGAGPASTALQIASDSPYVQTLMAQPAPRDADAYAAVAARLSALGRTDARAAFDAWMERHVWLRLLGKSDAMPVSVADAVAAGDAATAELADLRAQVLTQSLRLDVDEAPGEAMLKQAVDARAPANLRVLVAEAPGLWSQKVPWNAYEMHLALRVTNAASTPVGAFRVIVTWNGAPDQRMVCERSDATPIPPGDSVTVWCRDLGGDGRQQPVRDPQRWRGDGHAPGVANVVATDSTLDFPALEVRVPGFERSAFFMGDLRGVGTDVGHEIRRLDCTQLGTCVRALFAPQAMNIAALAWALLMLVLVVVAFSMRWYRLPIVLLAFYTSWTALGRAMLASRGDAYFSSSIAGAAIWLLAGGALAFLAWYSRASGTALAPARGALAAAARPHVASVADGAPRVGTATIIVRVVVAIVVIGIVLAAAAFGVILYGLSHWNG